MRLCVPVCLELPYTPFQSYDGQDGKEVETGRWSGEGGDVDAVLETEEDRNYLMTRIFESFRHVIVWIIDAVWAGLLSTWHSYPGLHTSGHNCGKMVK